MNDSQVLLQLIGGKSKVVVIPGEYRGVDDGRALVDFNGGRVPANTLGGLPALNESVWVAVIDGVPFMLGPTAPRPSEGTVVSASSGEATVSTVIGNITARYDTGVLSPTTNDEVFLVWGAGAFIAGVTAAADEGDVPEAPGSTQTKFTKTFTARDSGSYQSGFGWRTNDVWCSASNVGAWFYGTKIKDTIPDSASIVKAEIYLPRPIRLLGAMPFGRHTSASKPGGAVSVTNTSTLPGTSGWVTIPTSHVDFLKANTGGLGFALGGYSIWPGTQSNGQSGALRVTYRT